MRINTLISKVRAKLNVWQDVSQQRRDMRKLSDHLLDDIGLAPIHAEREGNRPFWDISDKCNPSTFKQHRVSGLTPHLRTCVLYKCVKCS